MNTFRWTRAKISAAVKSPALYRFVLLMMSVGPGRKQTDSHLLICPPGAGNLGDQALVDSFVENVPGKVTLLMRAPSDFDVPVEKRSRVSVAAIPHLVYGKFPQNIRAAATFAQHLRGAKSVSIVGADVMDGAYNFRAAANRAAISEVSARRGVPTRILGFSWNSTPHRTSLAYLRRASRHGVDLFIRDPRSAARARADGLSRVFEAADIVFAAESTDDAASKILETLFTENDRPIALLNVSGLIGKEISLTPEYVAIVEGLVRTYNVLLVPHVVKEDSDDLEACREVYSQLEDTNRVSLFTDKLTPDTVRGLCARSSMIITGRMHLAVNGLLQGRLPVVLATQGKVEGLMELFDASDLCIEPRIGMSHEILDKAPTTQGTDISDALAEVKTLAMRNFRGLSAAISDNRAI